MKQSPTIDPPHWARHLPWIDSAAGLLVGLAVLLFRHPLETFYGLSESMVVVMGAVNAGYAAFGLALGISRSKVALRVLVAANLFWMGMCVILIGSFASHASVFGLAHFAVEGVVVALFAALEWRYRSAILARRTSTR